MFRSIGICVFASPPPLMLPLGALLLLAAVIAGHARSSAVLAFRDRQASCADQSSPAPVQIVLEDTLMSTRHAAYARVCAAAVLATLCCFAGCRACQSGDVKEAAPLQEPLLGCTRAASLGGLPKSLKSPFGGRLSAIAPASREASDGCDGAEILGGPSSSLAGSQVRSRLLPLGSAGTALLHGIVPACMAYLSDPPDD